MMKINDITARRIGVKDIGQLFALSKISLLERGIENIRDDILMTQLKNGVARRLQSFDYGLFQMNTLVGYIFSDVSSRAYDDTGSAMVESVYLLPEFRTVENYCKLLQCMVNLMAEFDITDIKTTDNWTLSNDCEIFEQAILLMGKPATMYRILP
jgi:hypothetical protein